ncbi:MAG: sodium:proton antiporter [Candidatus Omnitrophica bacterium]|nr:sodium:proton antiporter [Candidatus Omnitrophota bacterium]MCM8808740.1 sodium:proton antiporter [Candidatus Omnitrophota bacterium]MCM8810216.1 sodium:proton antiporter [Candidatus Omnitrophota bacterium]
MIYYLCFVLFLIGLYGVTCKKNVVKIILGLWIMEYSVNLFLILLGYRKNGIAPILKKGDDIVEFAQKAVDPLPQAMVLTSIVIGLGVLALMVTVAIRLYQRYGTFDITEMKKLKG